MRYWKCFLDSLDSPGGHLVLLFVLFNEGIAFYHFIDPTGGGQIMNLSFGALSGYLIAKKSNKEQENTSSSTQSSTQTTISNTSKKTGDEFNKD